MQGLLRSYASEACRLAIAPSAPGCRFAHRGVERASLRLLLVHRWCCLPERACKAADAAVPRRLEGSMRPIGGPDDWQLHLLARRDKGLEDVLVREAGCARTNG